LTAEDAEDAEDAEEHRICLRVPGGFPIISRVLGGSDPHAVTGADARNTAR